MTNKFTEISEMTTPDDISFMNDTTMTTSCDNSDAGQSLKERLLSFIKRRQTWGFLVSIAIMAAISVAFFYPANVNGDELRQHDMQQGLANGREIQIYEDLTGNQSRWTNSLFSGMPTFQISPAYPSDSLFKWITTVYGLGLPSPSNLLFMMMAGFMILMMVLKIRWEYGLIGAIAWGFSTYFIIIIGAGHIWKFVTLAYIPPTIAGILLAYRGRYLAGGAMAGVFAMMQIVSNHVQMSYYFGFVIAAVSVAYLFDSIRRHRIRHWAKATAVLAVAAALAVAANLPNLYHTSKYASESQRSVSELSDGSNDATSGLNRDYITQFSYGQAETLTLLIPNIKGGATVKPVNGAITLSPLSDLDAAKDYRDQVSQYYLPQIPQYFGEPEMTNGPVYVGAIVFALFILGCIVVKGPLKWAMLVVTLLSVLLAWGRNFMGLTDIFIDLIPMYNKFRTVESILVIAEFTIPLLAVMGLATILRAKPTWEKYKTPVCISFGISAMICLLGWLFPGIYGVEDELTRNVAGQMPDLYNTIIDLRRSMVSADSLRSLLFISAAFATLLLYASGKIKDLVAGAAIGVLVLADLYTVDKRYIDNDSFYHPTIAEKAKTKDAPIPMTEADRLILQDTAMNYRVMDIDRFNSADPSYYHKMIGGYHAAKIGRYNDLINRHLGSLQSEADFNILNMLNARYFVYQGQVERNPDALGNAWFVGNIRYVDNARQEMDALDSIDPATEAVADKSFRNILGTAEICKCDEPWKIYETTYAPDRLTYRSHTPADGIAVFSEVYFPWGWEATIDGKPAEIGRVNYILRALRIPAGDHQITMTFRPASVGTTVTIATVAVVMIYLAVAAALASALIPCRKKKK